MLKIAFVSALLGFGGSDFKQIGSLYQALYVVPLFTTFFDLLIIGEHFSVRRVGTFLRLCSPNDSERVYESFVGKNRDVFFKLGSVGFTLISYFAAVVLLWRSKHFRHWLEWVWFVVLFLIFALSNWYGGRRLRKLDQLSQIS